MALNHLREQLNSKSQRAYLARLIAMTLLFLEGCSSSAQTQPGAFTLTSPSFADGDALPTKFTCDGLGETPALAWENAPEGTQSYAVLMEHYPPEATPKPDSYDDGAKWYWLLYDIPADTTSLAQGEVEGIQGTNSTTGNPEYAPPCSQGPGIKTYTWIAYALSESPDLPAATEVTRPSLLEAIDPFILASSELSTSYERTSSETPDE